MRYSSQWRVGVLTLPVAGAVMFVLLGTQPVVRSAAVTRVQERTIKRSVLDAVYTEAQAKRGRERYRRCILCHLDKGQGDPAGQGVPIAGEVFQKTWSGHSVKELFEKIKTTMPLDAPGSLTPQQYADVLSYIFQMNKYPPGQEELSSDDSALEQITIEPVTGAER